jgi:hypothetical protein
MKTAVIAFSGLIAGSVLFAGSAQADQATVNYFVAELGTDVCQVFNAQGLTHQSLLEVGALLMNKNEGDLSAKDAADVVVDSVAEYCPNKTNKLERVSATLNEPD